MIRQLELGHEDNHAALSPSGEQIISAINKTLVVWDATTGEKIAEVQEQHRITCVAWSPEGQRFVSAGQEGQLHIWRAGVERPLAVAMALHGRLGRGSPLAALDPELIRAIVLRLPADWGGAAPPPV
jgi:WD40 repeat protein